MKQPIPFGKYYLLERINVGGMAEVFRAKAYGVEGFERLVAVKRILPNIAEDTEFIKMFIDEAKIAVQLNHANIAQVFDLGRVGSSYYIALEHIHGRDLRALFDRCRQIGEAMPIAQACFLTMKVCEGLDYAHNKRDQSSRPLGLVHRDVSPQNVLCSFEGEVKVIDFGIAKAAGRCSKTQAGILKGKFGYMSPEQVRGLPINRRSDVFSTGIVLYELLTGERLFVGESDFSILEKVRNVEISPPSKYNRRIPPALERIVLKALAKDVEARYQNAIDLHDDLQAFVYSSGEFYSRKDLAAWMKEKFAKEIRAETAKLEKYRKLRPPEIEDPETRQPRTAPTVSLIGESKAERPRRAHGSPRAEATASLLGGVHSTRWEDSVSDSSYFDDGSYSGTAAGFTDHSYLAAGESATADVGGTELGGEIATLGNETRPDLAHLVSKVKPKPKPKPEPRAARQGPVLAELTPMPSVEERAWTDPPARAPSAAARAGSPRLDSPQGEALMNASGQLPVVSRPISPSMTSPPLPHAAASGGFPRSQLPLVNAYPPPPPRRRSGIGTVFLALLMLVGVGALTSYGLSSRDDASNTEPVAGAGGEQGSSDDAARDVPNPVEARTMPGDSAAPTRGPVTRDPDTGFELFVQPDVPVTVFLDGKRIAQKPPLRRENLAPGTHELVIEPAGAYRKLTHTIELERGNVADVSLTLEPAAVQASFVAEPRGARVFLYTDDNRRYLGRAPQSATLDPTKTYRVQFEKSGYEDGEQTIEFTSSATLEVAVTLERKRRDRDDDEIRPGADRDEFGETGEEIDEGVALEKVDNATGEEAFVDDEPEPEYGTLRLQAKPPCRILIDGAPRGRTPQRNLRVRAGSHRITLINSEFGIRESFRVRVGAGEIRTVVKNLTHLIQ